MWKVANTINDSTSVDKSFPWEEVLVLLNLIIGIVYLIILYWNYILYLYYLKCTWRRSHLILALLYSSASTFIDADETPCTSRLYSSQYAEREVQDSGRYGSSRNTRRRQHLISDLARAMHYSNRYCRRRRHRCRRRRSRPYCLLIVWVGRKQIPHPLSLLAHFLSINMWPICANDDGRLMTC